MKENGLLWYRVDLRVSQTMCALMRHQALLTIQAKLKLAIKLILLLFYFSVVIHSGEFLASASKEKGNLKVLRRFYVQIYPTMVFLLCWGKAVILQHM